MDDIKTGLEQLMMDMMHFGCETCPKNTSCFDAVDCMEAYEAKKCEWALKIGDVYRKCMEYSS